MKMESEHENGNEYCHCTSLFISITDKSQKMVLVYKMANSYQTPKAEDDVIKLLALFDCPINV